MAIKHWTDEIFEKLHRKVTSAALELIEQDRNGKMIESSLVKIVVESYGEFLMMHFGLFKSFLVS